MRCGLTWSEDRVTHHVYHGRRAGEQDGPCLVEYLHRKPMCAAIDIAEVKVGIAGGLSWRSVQKQSQTVTWPQIRAYLGCNAQVACIITYGSVVRGGSDAQELIICSDWFFVLVGFVLDYP